MKQGREKCRFGSVTFSSLHQSRTPFVAIIYLSFLLTENIPHDDSHHIPISFVLLLLSFHMLTTFPCFTSFHMAFSYNALVYKTQSKYFSEREYYTFKLSWYSFCVPVSTTETLSKSLLVVRLSQDHTHAYTFTLVWAAHDVTMLSVCHCLLNHQFLAPARYFAKVSLKNILEDI